MKNRAKHNKTTRESEALNQLQAQMEKKILLHRYVKIVFANTSEEMDEKLKPVQNKTIQEQWRESERVKRPSLKHWEGFKSFDDWADNEVKKLIWKEGSEGSEYFNSLLNRKPLEFPKPISTSDLIKELKNTYDKMPKFRDRRFGTFIPSLWDVEKFKLLYGDWKDEPKRFSEEDERETTEDILLKFTKEVDKIRKCSQREPIGIARPLYDLLASDFEVPTYRGFKLIPIDDAPHKKWLTHPIDLSSIRVVWGSDGRVRNYLKSSNQLNK